MKCDCIDSIIVSSDSDLILGFATNFEGVLTLMRPKSLSTDDASSVEVLEHATNEMKDQNFTHVLYLEPTAPLRSTDTINRTIDALKNYKATMTIVECDGIFRIMKKK